MFTEAINNFLCKEIKDSSILAYTITRNVSKN